MKSRAFYMIKAHYENHFWSKPMVKNAVIKGKITAAEYEEITGEAYE